MPQHPMVQFYANDRDKCEQDKTSSRLHLKTYEDMDFPLILFISREPNHEMGELNKKIGFYGYNKATTHNWTRPLSVIAYILGEDRIKLKEIIMKYGLSPIILSYKHSCSIPNPVSNKEHLRNSINHDIEDVLRGYKINIIIDHSNINREKIPFKSISPNNYIFLDTYLGSRVGDKALFEEIKKKFDDDRLNKIRHIWKEYLSKMGN